MNTSRAALDLLHVASGDLWGGAEAQVSLLVPALAARGHRVRAVIFNRGRLTRELEAAGVATTVLQEEKGTLAVWLGLRRLLKKSPPDVLHAHGYKESLVAFSASAGLGITRVRTLHGVPELPVGGNARKMALYDSLESGLARALRVHAIAVSRDLEASERGRWNGRVARVPNTAAPPKPSAHAAETRRELAGDAAATILYAGRLEPIKGPDLLLEAFALIAPTLPAARLLIAGSGSLGASLKERAQALGVQGAVHFLGDRDDIPDLLAAVDLVVMPSRGEGMPTFLLEALMAGKAIVATRVGGIPEVTGGDERARLVPAQDVEALAAACREILCDPQLRARMEEQARQGDHNAPEKCAAATEQVYRGLLD